VLAAIMLCQPIPHVCLPLVFPRDRPIKAEVDIVVFQRLQEVVMDRARALAADRADTHQISVAVVILHDHVLIEMLVFALGMALAALGGERGFVLVRNLCVLVPQALFLVAASHMSPLLLLFLLSTKAIVTREKPKSQRETSCDRDASLGTIDLAAKLAHHARALGVAAVGEETAIAVF